MALLFDRTYRFVQTNSVTVIHSYIHSSQANWGMITMNKLTCALGILLIIYLVSFTFQSVIGGSDSFEICGELCRSEQCCDILTTSGRNQCEDVCQDICRSFVDMEESGMEDVDLSQSEFLPQLRHFMIERGVRWPEIPFKKLVPLQIQRDDPNEPKG